MTHEGGQTQVTETLYLTKDYHQAQEMAGEEARLAEALRKGERQVRDLMTRIEESVSRRRRSEEP